MRAGDWTCGRRNAAVAAGAASTHFGDSMDGDRWAVPDPGSGPDGVREWAAFDAARARALAGIFPASALRGGQQPGDFGRGGSVRGTGADAAGSMGADGGDYPGSAGAVPSAVGD